MRTYHDAIEQLARDRTFRDAIMQDATAALKPYDLSAAERAEILQQAEMMEAGVQQDPLESAEEVDDGQADAAGSKD